MARMLNWNIQKAIPEISKASMPILMECANIFRNEAKLHLRPQLELNWKPFGPPPGGDIWEGREDYAEMLNTIRVVEKHDTKALFGKTRNIRIYAGNYKVWWALQMEYGRGGWHGGARSFFRKAIRTSKPKIRTLLASKRI